MSAEATRPPSPPPGAVMMQFLSGFQVSQAVYVVARLDVATVLEQQGAARVGELAVRVGADPSMLARLVRTLAPLGVFRTVGDVVELTDVGATLSSAHPHSMRDMALLLMETHYLPFSELLHSVRTGRPGADSFLGRAFFDWMNDDVERSALFSRAMAEITTTLKEGVFDDYRLPPGDVVADIGGSDGSVLVELLARDEAPGRRGVVFDLPAVIPSAQRRMAATRMAEHVELLAGDFFVSVPRADVYVLSTVLHDWDDYSCRRILDSIATAAAPGARLLIIEGLVPPGDEPHLSKALDLTMMGVVTGRERSEDEYRDLLIASGFAFDRAVPTTSPFSIIEATAVAASDVAAEVKRH